MTTATEQLHEAIAAYNDAWNAHDVERIRALHAPGGAIEVQPSGRRIEWDGMDVIPFEDGRVKRKDVYSDSVSILRQVGLL